MIHFRMRANRQTKPENLMLLAAHTENELFISEYEQADKPRVNLMLLAAHTENE